MSGDRILVVDDERGMLRSLQRLLEPHYEVRTVDAAAAAPDVAREFEPDLAILDVRMPEIDGFELMVRLRAIRPDVDVIFMTGAVQELDAALIRAIRERAFYFIQKPFDREVLLTLVERCLELRRLASENRTYVARLERELADARSFQRGLLPEPVARQGAVSIAGSYEPCDELGGDLYDYVDAGAGRTAALVADVSGHGVNAAMLTAIVKSAFHDAHTDEYAPLAVVRRVANALRPFDDDRFVTLFCARLDGRSLEYVNAGHPPAVLFGPSRERATLGLTGPMISPAFPDIGWDVERVELRAGDRLLAYTDGIVEARGPEGLFGDERLFALLDRRAESGTELLARIEETVHRFAAGRPVDDDRTLLALTIEGSGSRSGPARAG